MKKILITILVVLFSFILFGQEYSEGNLDSIIQKAKAEEKVVLLKFYSDTCSWCKKLDKEVLIPEYLNKLSRLAVLYKINVKSENGKILKEKYNIKGVPTVVLLSKDGTEIDRIVGYEEKEIFLKELLSYIFNIGTLDDLTSRTEKEASFDLFFTIASKYFERGELNKSIEFIEKAKGYKEIDDNKKTNLDLLEGEVFLSKEPDKGIEILSNIVESAKKDASESAFEELVRYFKKTENYDSLVMIYKKVLPKKQDDVSFLNSFAWTMAEINKSLDEALEAAKKASTLSNEDPQILDTLAEVYFKMGDLKSALKTIDKAIGKEPNDEYYKKQKEKFSKKTKV